MKGLLIKDFKLLKEQRIFLLIFTAIYVLLTAASDENSFYVGLLGFLASLLTLSTASYDEYDNGYAFLFCLPISRKTYVLEKYCFGLILIGASWLFETAVALFVSTVNNSVAAAELLTAAFLVLPVIISVLTVMLPFQLKFGGEKGKIAIMGFFALLAVLAVYASKIADLLHVDLNSAFDGVSGVKTGAFAALEIAAAAVIMLISVKISISIMNKKEF